jgi:hypothetical protein
VTPRAERRVTEAPWIRDARFPERVVALRHARNSCPRTRISCFMRSGAQEQHVPCAGVAGAGNSRPSRHSGSGGSG